MDAGGNQITRKSVDSSVTVPDSPSLDWLESSSAADRAKFARSCGIPQRLLLPKGKTDGMEFALMVAVTDGAADKAVENPGDSHSQCGTHGGTYPDKKPMGFPLDRTITDKSVFLDTPNFKRIFVKVTHDDHH